MKKLCFVFIAVFIFSISVFAKPGDIAGKYYSTDIITTLNGVEIDAINIGGETLISAEDMKYYGFHVLWDAKARELRITSKDHANDGIPPSVKKSSLPSGSVLGNYFETDIKTYLDNKIITAYNIGGRTYIHAEETRQHGFDAVWNGNDRTLKITSSKFAGYEYSFIMAQGKPQSVEGSGAFKLVYTKDNIIGYGDAEYFSSSFSSQSKSYYVFLQFYQNDGLFYSSKLLDILREHAENNTNAAEDIFFAVNGKIAKNLIVSEYKGNGHNSYYVICEEMLKLKEDEIESIVISVGTEISETPFEISNAEQYGSKAKKIFKSAKKYSLDWLEAFWELDEYTVLNVCESEHLGKVTNRLYIADKEGNLSEDILKQVREIGGFNEAKLRIYSVKIGDVKTNFFFSCASSKKNGDFYVELDTGKLHLIAEKDR
ncbi:MAG: hypothetical protein E7613_01255 [Ruminococcaceae bacterium]|nr:hypothetical protein [Oscillospiraceae bacterium]